jgi:hypothetical protein
MIKLMHPNGALEWKYIPLDWMLIGKPRIIDVHIVSDEVRLSVLVAATSENRLRISVDGGSTWNVLGIDIINGYDLGAFTPGQRKAAKIEAKIPVGPFREELVGLEFGEGT